eukprot:scaffold17604_cov122-Isochrysis_galbana.AAC.1
MKSRHSTRLRTLSSAPSSSRNACGEAKTPAEAKACGSRDVGTEPRASSSAAANARASATRESTVSCPASGARATTPAPPSGASRPPPVACRARSLDAATATSSNPPAPALAAGCGPVRALGPALSRAYTRPRKPSPAARDGRQPCWPAPARPAAGRPWYRPLPLAYSSSSRRPPWPWRRRGRSAPHWLVEPWACPGLER